MSNKNLPSARELRRKNFNRIRAAEERVRYELAKEQTKTAYTATFLDNASTVSSHTQSSQSGQSATTQSTIDSFPYVNDFDTQSVATEGSNHTQQTWQSNHTRLTNDSRFSRLSEQQSSSSQTPMPPVESIFDNQSSNGGSVNNDGVFGQTLNNPNVPNNGPPLELRRNRRTVERSRSPGVFRRRGKIDESIFGRFKAFFGRGPTTPTPAISRDKLPRNFRPNVSRVNGAILERIREDVLNRRNDKLDHPGFWRLGKTTYKNMAESLEPFLGSGVSVSDVDMERVRRSEVLKDGINNLKATFDKFVIGNKLMERNDSASYGVEINDYMRMCDYLVTRQCEDDNVNIVNKVKDVLLGVQFILREIENWHKNRQVQFTAGSLPYIILLYYKKQSCEWLATEDNLNDIKNAFDEFKGLKDAKFRALVNEGLDNNTGAVRGDITMYQLSYMVCVIMSLKLSAAVEPSRLSVFVKAMPKNKWVLGTGTLFALLVGGYIAHQTVSTTVDVWNWLFKVSCYYYDGSSSNFNGVGGCSPGLIRSRGPYAHMINLLCHSLLSPETCDNYNIKFSTIPTNAGVDLHPDDKIDTLHASYNARYWKPAALGLVICFVVSYCFEEAPALSFDESFMNKSTSMFVPNQGKFKNSRFVKDALPVSMVVDYGIDQLGMNYQDKEGPTQAFSGLLAKQSDKDIKVDVVGDHCNGRALNLDLTTVDDYLIDVFENTYRTMKRVKTQFPEFKFSKKLVYFISCQNGTLSTVDVMKLSKRMSKTKYLSVKPEGNTKEMNAELDGILHPGWRVMSKNILYDALDELKAVVCHFYVESIFSYVGVECSPEVNSLLFIGFKATDKSIISKDGFTLLTNIFGAMFTGMGLSYLGIKNVIRSAWSKLELRDEQFTNLPTSKWSLWLICTDIINLHLASTWFNDSRPMTWWNIFGTSTLQLQYEEGRLGAKTRFTTKIKHSSVHQMLYIVNVTNTMINDGLTRAQREFYATLEKHNSLVGCYFPADNSANEFTFNPRSFNNRTLPSMKKTIMKNFDPKEGLIAKQKEEQEQVIIDMYKKISKIVITKKDTGESVYKKLCENDNNNDQLNGDELDKCKRILCVHRIAKYCKTFKLEKSKFEENTAFFSPYFEEVLLAHRKKSVEYFQRVNFVSNLKLREITSECEVAGLLEAIDKYTNALENHLKINQKFQTLKDILSDESFKILDKFIDHVYNHKNPGLIKKSFEKKRMSRHVGGDLNGEKIDIIAGQKAAEQFYNALNKMPLSDMTKAIKEVNAFRSEFFQRLVNLIKFLQNYEHLVNIQ